MKPVYNEELKKSIIEELLNRIVAGTIKPYSINKSYFHYQIEIGTKSYAVDWFYSIVGLTDASVNECSWSK